MAGGRGKPAAAGHRRFRRRRTRTGGPVPTGAPPAPGGPPGPPGPPTRPRPTGPVP